MGQRGALAFLTAAVITSLSCGLTQRRAPAPPSTAAPASATPSPAPSATSLPSLVEPRARLQVRGDRFVDPATGDEFVPRGVNHILITGSGDCALAVGRYRRGEIRAIFQRLADSGFNTVRLFLDTCGDPINGLGLASGGLNPDVLDNIVDLMTAARSNGIYLLLTSNDLPENGGYWGISDEGFEAGTFGPYRNTHYLTQAGVRSAVTYWEDLMKGLTEREAPFDALLGWQLLNEQWYFNNEPPFSLSEGLVATATGQTYDMADLEEKQAMANDAIIYWMEQVSQVIRAYDPQALITMGFFDTGDTLQFPERDFRYNDVAAMLQHSPLDFIDFHVYPGGGADIYQSAEAIGLTGYDQKPVILGEFGAFRQAYSTPEIGAQVVAAWMEGSCHAGFDGWLYWVYGEVDHGAPDDPWGFVEGDGVIMDTLSPLNSPDPCDLAPSPAGAINLAYGADVRASRTEESELDEYVPARAVDFSLQSWWSAAEGAPQSLEIDLGEPATIERVVLVDLFAGVGRHVSNIWGSGPGTEGELLLASLDVVNDQEEMRLDHSLPEPVPGVSAVRVETTIAPGWVIWHEVQIYGTRDE